MPKKKAKKKPYFGIEVQEAIIEYNSLDKDSDTEERNQIYQKRIHAAFDKLAENIINTFKFTYFDDPFMDVKHEVVAFMVMNIHKYDHTKGSKAFSYFSVVAKNYLILHNNANYKKYCATKDISYLDNKPERIDSDADVLMSELIIYFDENIPRIFNKRKDVEIAYSIVEILKRHEEIENFNKKALYILIREMTNVETSYITKVANVMRGHYKNLLKDFDKYGTLTPKDKGFIKFKL